MLSLTYVSTASRDLDVNHFLDLLVLIRAHNVNSQITGMLLYSGGSVIQVLEGPGAAVDRTFAAIERDPRHRGIIVMLRETIYERAFPDWSMGFEHLPSGLDPVPGINNFATHGVKEPNSGSARRLLEVFRETMR